MSKPKPIEEVLKENKRAINKAIREIEKEVTRMERKQKEMATNIKRMAKKNQTASVKVVVKDFVRMKGHISRLIMFKTQLNAIALKMQTMKSHQALTSAMNGAFGCMKRMNAAVSLPAMQEIMRDFQYENEKAEEYQENMDELIDDVMGEDDAEMEEDAIFNQVMDELGIENSAALPEAAQGNGEKDSEKTTAIQVPTAAGGTGGPTPPIPPSTDPKDKDDKGNDGGGGGGGGDTTLDDLKDRVAKLQHLRR